MIKQRISNILKNKKLGNGDIIAGLIVLLSLSIILIIFVDSNSALVTRNQMDQITRAYLLRMESAGELSATDENALRAELANIVTVKSAIDSGKASSGDIEITWNDNKGALGYGSEITLTIDCPALIPEWTAGKAFGSMKSVVKVFHITKQSTAKY